MVVDVRVSWGALPVAFIVGLVARRPCTPGTTSTIVYVAARHGAGR
jgi:hypothetical protein